MPKIDAFEKHSDAYEGWFDKHPNVYASELEAVRQLWPKEGRGLEVGIGTGRFAQPLGVHLGVEPSQAMRKLARAKGLEAVDGVAEALPFDDAQFDCVLFVTTICFVDSVEKAFNEAYRVLKPGGSIVIGFIDRDSALGAEYDLRRKASRFYKDATFQSADDVVAMLESAGFADLTFVQTIVQNPDDVNGIQPVEPGRGKGSFLVVKAMKM